MKLLDVLDGRVRGASLRRDTYGKRRMGFWLQAAVLSVMLLAVPSLYAQSDNTLVWETGFEEGDPADWKSEQTEGPAGHDWVVVSCPGDDCSYPDAAYDGTSRIQLKNDGNATIGYVTRLVLPALNVTGGGNPVVTFAYSLQNRSRNNDVLRVLYRTETTGRWITLREYTDRTNGWELDTVNLIAPSRSYEIAFEGEDHLGHGVMLDEIKVFTKKPECVPPSMVNSSNVENTSFMLRWSDTQSDFHVKISDRQLTDSELDDPNNKANVVDTIIGVSRLEVKNLEKGTEYFVYISSMCDAETHSLWSKELSVTTTNVVPVPAKFDFNEYSFNLGVNIRPEEWRFGSDDDMVMMPAVNTALTMSCWGTAEDYSPDGTPALVFYGDGCLYNPVSAKIRQWAVTPAMDTEDLSIFQVSFTGMKPDNNARARIIVGVTTDPNAISSKLARIDTVEVLKSKTPTEFIVPLDRYKELMEAEGQKADGKYIVFMSDFDEPNQFAIDNISVDTISECMRIQEVSLSVKSSDEVTVTWEDLKPDYSEILFSEEKLEGEDEINGHASEAKKVDAGKSSYTAGSDIIEPDTEYWVYVRNVCGESKSLWSAAQNFRTPGKLEALPQTINFDDAGERYSLAVNEWSESKMMQNGLVVLASNDEYGAQPEVTSNYVAEPVSADSKGHLNIDANGGASVVVVFPELADLTGSRAILWSTMSNFYAGMSNMSFEAGVISDAADASTFVSLETISVTVDVWERHIIALDSYADKVGDANFFAVRVASDGSQNDAIIDNVQFIKVPECKDPLNVKVEPGEKNATVTWDANGMSSWNVRVAAENVYDSLDSETYEWVFSQDKVSEPKVVVDNLEPRKQTYYFYIQSYCSDDDKGLWSLAYTFQTNCLEDETLPWTMNFEGYPQGAQTEFAVPCMPVRVTTVDQGANQGSFPYIGTYFDEANRKQVAAMTMMSYGDADDYKFGCTAALPHFVGDDVRNLVLTCRIFNQGETGDTLLVGVIDHPDRPETFVTVAKLTSAGGAVAAWENAAVYFTSSPKQDGYIAFQTPEGASVHYLVTDIKVAANDGGCPVMQSLYVTDFGSDYAQLSWRGSGAEDEKWEVVVSTKTLSQEDLNEVMEGTYGEMDVIKFSKEVNENPVTVDGLSPETGYCFYVRAVCDGGGQWSEGKFSTGCGTVAPETLGLVSFDDEENPMPDCWVVGNRYITGAGESDTEKEHVPYISADWSHSGGNSVKIHASKQYSMPYLMSQALEVEDDGSANNMNGYQVTFWASATSQYAISKYQRQIAVGIATSPSDISSVQPVGKVDVYADEQPYVVDFYDFYAGTYTPKGRYLVFYSDASLENAYYVDDIQIEKIDASCRKPVDFDVTGITENTATLTWRLAGQADAAGGSFDYVLSDSRLSDEELQSASAKQTSTGSVALTGLEGHTTYYFYVRSACDNDGWVMTRFTTECPSSLQLPARFDFDSQAGDGVGVAPDCWQTLYTDEAKGEDYPYVTADGYDGKGLDFHYSFADPMMGTVGGFSYAATAPLAADADEGLHISFYAGTNVDVQLNEAKVVVGLVDEGTRLSEAVTVAEVKLTSMDFRKYFADIPAGTVKGGQRIVFSFTTDYTEADIVLDDIMIEEGSSCPRPDLFVLDEVADRSVSFSFTDMGDASEWEVAYREAGSEAALSAVKTSGGENHTFSGLQPATQYEIYARAVCGATPGEWSEPLLVRTATALVEDESYTTGFETSDDNSAWAFVGFGADSWVIGSADKCGGSQSLYISDDGTNAGYSVREAATAYAYRSISLKAGIYDFSASYKVGGESGADMLSIFILPSTVQFGDGALLMPDGIRMNPADLAGTEGTILLQGKSGVAACTNATANMVVSEEQEGVYNIVVMWENNGNNQGTVSPSAVVDDLSATYAPCAYPLDVQVSGITYDGATVTWTPLGDAAVNWEVKLDMTGGNEPDADAKDFSTADGSTTAQTLSGLTENVTYHVFVRAVCGEGSQSEWRKASFTTPCRPIDISAEDFSVEYGFEDGSLPACFTNYDNGFQVLVGGELAGGMCYAHEGDAAIAIGHMWSTSNMGAYLALPAMTPSFNGKQISFWMRPVYAYTSGGFLDNMSMDYVNHHKVTVGTTSDPSDPAAFHELQVCEYPYTANDLVGNEVDDESGNKWWIKVVVSLDAAVEGDSYIVIKDGPYADLGSNIMYIDDIKVEKLQPCVAPYALEVYDQKSASVMIKFNQENGTKWKYEVSETEAFVNVVKEGEMDKSDGFEITGLEPQTQYYVRVAQDCDGQWSDWSVVRSFQTMAELRFYEPFDGPERVPALWTRATLISPDDVFGKENPEFQYMQDSESGGWERFEPNDWAKSHEYVRLTAETQAWLFSPVMTIEAGKKAQLSFDLALTLNPQGAALGQTELQNGQNNKFYVMVSEDGGRTWLEENAVIWSNESSGDSTFNDISNAWRKVYIDMSGYVGNNVQVAFYAQCSSFDYTVYLHIDNVQVNYLDVDHEDVAWCETNDYVERGFEVKREDFAPVGETKYFEHRTNSTDDEPDVLYSVNITTVKSPFAEISDTICFGGEFSYESIQGVSKTGYYDIVYPASDPEACDSVFRVNLTVAPDLRKDEGVREICHGGYIMWRGHKCDSTADYTAVVPSDVWLGCDSVITLHVNVLGAEVHEYTHYLCKGDTLDFGDKTFVSDGSGAEQTATYTFDNNGCDSTVRLTVVYADDKRAVIERAICDGETYTGDGFHGIDPISGTDSLHTETTMGCDSTVILNLLKIKNDGETIDVTRTISPRDLPYEFFGEEFPVGTSVGTYTKEGIEVTSASGNCSATVNLTLIIDNTVGVERPVTVRTLMLTPNPVAPGEDVTVHLDLNAQELDGAVLQVYTSTGSLVRQFRPDMKPIVISGLNVSGVYVVRITDGLGNIYNGKIIVR